MIEQALRKRLQPTVNRRRRLYLALWLSACWLASVLVGIGLIIAYWLLGWKSSIANWALCITSGLATIFILYKSLRLRLDYKAVARDIERKHPDLKALLLTAIEQEPDQPGGSLSYLQERVIGEAVRHAVKYDWLRSVSSTKLVMAQICWFVTLALLITAFSQLLTIRPFLLRTDGNVLARRGYQIMVTPGDTNVEAGSPVVILARFEGRMPREATLVYEAPGEELHQISMTKNMEDPVFGGIIQEVNSNLLYRIEYADQSTRDYNISVYKYPTLTRADAKIIYPAYTKLPEKIIQDTRRISVIEGSQITLTFTLNKAVTSARLIPKEGAAPELTVDSEHPNVYTASVTATADRRYELNLVDAQGLTNEMPQRFTINVHKNLPPEIKPIFPNRDVLASPLEELSLEAEISDDYGVTHYGLGYALVGVQSADITLSSLEERQEKQTFQHLLALENLGARPDQLLTYYFWADDVGPDGKSRRTSSDMYFAEVRHFDEIFRESQSSQNQNRQNQSGEQQRQQGGQLAELQKQIIIATWNIKRQADPSGKLDDQKEGLDVVRQSQSDVLEQARSTMAQAREPDAIKTLKSAMEYMETSLDHLIEAEASSAAEELTPALAAEQSAYQELLKLKQREHQVGQSRRSSASGTPRSARSERQLQQLELNQREDRYETERLAQSQEQTMQQREDLQVHNRLRDLARRQSEMSDKLKEVETALRQAQNEQQKEEIRRELKRLRDEQIEALRDVDELQERMERPENRQRMADTREQLDRSRSRIRQSAEQLERGMVSRAITSTTRAQRELEQMRDQFRRNTSSQFTEQMRRMREQAQQLDEHQKEIAEKMQQQVEAEQKTLKDIGQNRELATRMDQQKESMEDLIDQMKDVSEQAETSEPLLSRKLYETVRESSTKNIDRDLEITSELLRRNFLTQAQKIEQRAGQGIEELRKGVEEAAQSVLGDEAESLRLAREQLEELIRDVNEEVARANASARQRQARDPNESGSPAASQQLRAEARRGTGRGRGGDPNQPEGMQANQQRQAQTRAGASRGQGGDPNRPQESQATQRRLADGRTGRRLGDRRPGGRVDPRGWGGNRGALGPWDRDDPNGPLTGRDFIQWSDRLRDVEEILDRPELRNEAARVRDRARAIRAEFKRHGKEPQWDLVQQTITNPLSELRDRISEELASLESDEAMVPIDRDPVPGRFAELVRRYYENLGGEK